MAETLMLDGNTADVLPEVLTLRDNRTPALKLMMAKLELREALDRAVDDLEKAEELYEDAKESDDKKDMRRLAKVIKHHKETIKRVKPLVPAVMEMVRVCCITDRRPVVRSQEVQKGSFVVMENVYLELGELAMVPRDVADIMAANRHVTIIGE